MLCSIDTFDLADFTLPGGYALSEIKISVERIFDIVIPLDGTINPLPFDRVARRTSIDFQVTRTHASFEAADQYVLDHDAAIPNSGTVQFTTTDNTVAFLVNAALISFRQVKTYGKTTTIAYHIEGGEMSTTPPPTEFFILAEDGFYVLTETGDRIELEEAAPTVFYVLTETGDFILQETGDKIETE